MVTETNNFLGDLIQIYRYRPLRFVDFFTIFFLGLIAILCPLAYGLYLYYYGYSNFGPVAANNWSLPWYLLAIMAFITLLILSIYRLNIARRYVALHQNGLNIRIKQKQPLIWDQISGLSVSIVKKHILGIDLRTSYQATLHPNIGQPTRLDDGFENLPDLLTQIKAKLYPRLFSKLVPELEAGKLLYFGKIAISQNGLHTLHNMRWDSIAWKYVNSIAIKSGYLVISLADNRVQKYDIGDIANPELLLEIIQTTIEN